MKKPKQSVADTIRDALATDDEAMFRPGSDAVFCFYAAQKLLGGEGIEFFAMSGEYPVYRIKKSSH
jgi:hypothetical protein